MAAGASHCLHGWTSSVSITAAIRAARHGSTWSCATKRTHGLGDKSHPSFPAQTLPEPRPPTGRSSAIVGAGRAEGTAHEVTLVEGTVPCGGIQPQAWLINIKLY